MNTFLLGAIALLVGFVVACYCSVSDRLVIGCRLELFDFKICGGIMERIEGAQRSFCLAGSFRRGGDVGFWMRARIGLQIPFVDMSAGISEMLSAYSLS
jgi:hypothetical protein